MNASSRLRRLLIAALAASGWAGAASTPSQEITAYSKEIYSARFPQQTGEALYTGVCQGCHMPDAKGATGAGSYPALASNPRLASAAYPIFMVANGRKAMPWFGGVMTDQQIAEVVNYIRTHFGNNYTDAVTAANVKAIRRP
jgi:mono/diheme cytochrome c family protein